MTFTEIYEMKMAENGGRRPNEWMNEMARLCNISYDSIYQYCIGWRKPHPATIKLLEEHFGATEDELFPMQFGKKRLEEQRGEDLR